MIQYEEEMEDLLINKIPLRKILESVSYKKLHVQTEEKGKSTVNLFFSENESDDENFLVGTYNKNYLLKIWEEVYKYKPRIIYHF